MLTTNNLKHYILQHINENRGKLNLDIYLTVTKRVRVVSISHITLPANVLSDYFILQNNHHLPNETLAYKCLSRKNSVQKLYYNMCDIILLLELLFQMVFRAHTVFGISRPINSSNQYFLMQKSLYLILLKKHNFTFLTWFIKRIQLCDMMTWITTVPIWTLVMHDQKRGNSPTGRCHVCKMNKATISSEVFWWRLCHLVCIRSGIIMEQINYFPADQCWLLLGAKQLKYIETETNRRIGLW